MDDEQKLIDRLEELISLSSSGIELAVFSDGGGAIVNNDQGQKIAEFYGDELVFALAYMLGADFGEA